MVGGLVLDQTRRQSLFETRWADDKMVGRDPSKVGCQQKQGAGCYGHNLADDAAADAALLAITVPGRSVRLQYTRGQEHKWKPYGSAMGIKPKAGVRSLGPGY